MMKKLIHRPVLNNNVDANKYQLLSDHTTSSFIKASFLWFNLTDLNALLGLFFVHDPATSPSLLSLVLGNQDTTENIVDTWQRRLAVDTVNYAQYTNTLSRSISCVIIIFILQCALVT